MTNKINNLLKDLSKQSIAFKDVIEFIEGHYQHHATAFKNGDVYNDAMQNQGSAKVFAFGQLHNLTKEETLQLFAEHYHAVLKHPDGIDHQNIRQFIAHGWEGIAFEQAESLKVKA